MRAITFAPLVLPLLLACSPKPAVEEPLRAVLTLVVQGGNSVQQHEYAAEIRPRTESRLSFRVSGKLVQRMVNQGDAVRPGQALARIDAADLALAQDAARAAVNTALAQPALSETELRRYQALREQNFISALELERHETALKVARAQVEQASAQAGVQANQAGYALLVADAAGLVSPCTSLAVFDRLGIADHGVANPRDATQHPCGLRLVLGAPSRSRY